jgi:hypothetical protein
MDTFDLRNVLTSLEWSRRISFACTIILTAVFIWLLIFLIQRFHIGLFMLVFFTIAEFGVMCLLIPVIYLPYKKRFNQKIVPEFIKSKSTYLSLVEKKEIDRVDFMASQFFLKTPNDVWCEMVLKGAYKGYSMKCAMISINSSEQNRQGRHYENMFFNGLFIIATPAMISSKISCIDPIVLLTPNNEPYTQDANSLEMSISADSAFLTYVATKPIPNGTTRSIYTAKLPPQSLCVPATNIKIVRKKSNQVMFNDSVFNGSFTVYSHDSKLQNKINNSKFTQMILTAKEKNGKSFYFSKFDNVVFAAFERDKDDFNPPFFVPINEKIIKKLDVSFQKTLEEINQTIEIADYLK